MLGEEHVCASGEHHNQSNSIGKNVFDLRPLCSLNAIVLPPWSRFGIQTFRDLIGTPPRRSQDPPRGFQGAPRRIPDAPSHPKTPSRRSLAALKAPHDAQYAPKSRPQNAPKMPQDAPSHPQESFKTPKKDFSPAFVDFKMIHVSHLDDVCVTFGQSCGNMLAIIHQNVGIQQTLEHQKLCCA